MREAQLRLTGINASYGNTPVLTDVSLDVQQGEYMVVLLSLIHI